MVGLPVSGRFYHHPKGTTTIFKVVATTCREIAVMSIQLDCFPFICIYLINIHIGFISSSCCFKKTLRNGQNYSICKQHNAKQSTFEFKLHNDSQFVFLSCGYPQFFLKKAGFLGSWRRWSSAIPSCSSKKMSCSSLERVGTNFGGFQFKASKKGWTLVIFVFETIRSITYPINGWTLAMNVWLCKRMYPIGYQTNVPHRMSIPPRIP